MKSRDVCLLLLQKTVEGLMESDNETFFGWKGTSTQAALLSRSDKTQSEEKRQKLLDSGYYHTERSDTKV